MRMAEYCKMDEEGIELLKFVSELPESDVKGKSLLKEVLFVSDSVTFSSDVKEHPLWL